MPWIIAAEVAALAVVIGLIAYELADSAGSGTNATAPSAPAEPTTPDPAPRDIPLPALANPRLLVEKSEHRLTVFDGDRPVKCYRCAIGGGRRDKTREGDRCTPEGEFYVCVKNPDSKYVLSLGLSYPNLEDAERGLRDGLISRAEYHAIRHAIRVRGVPPWKTALGGEIMIHGNGAGRDWTLGCVALEDDDIRELYPAIPTGTPVEIRP